MVPGLALTLHFQFSGDMDTHSWADPGALLSPCYAWKVVQLLSSVIPTQFCSGFISASPLLFKQAL